MMPPLQTPDPFESRQHLPRPTTNRFLIIVVLLLVAAPLEWAAAQLLDEFGKKRAFDAENCVSACQVELDKGLFECEPYRKPEKGPAPEYCREALYESFDFCLKMCPANPRYQQ